jgi:Flp pilus assembly protein TadD
MRALAATAQLLPPLMLAAALLAAPAAQAAPAPAQAPTQAAAPTSAKATSAKAPAAPAPSKASREVRAQADRLEPLGRAAFWASQVDADPKDAEAGIKLASALRALGRFPEAQAAAEAVLVLEPNNLDALLESARTAVAEGQGFFAVEPTRKALAIAPKDWRAATLLAVALDQASRPVEAMEAHRVAMQMAPDNPAVLSNAAMFFAAQGDQAKAETLLRKAAALPGASLQVRQNLALVLGLQGKLEEAERLERENLPPQMAEANLDYFKAASAR